MFLEKNNLKTYFFNTQNRLLNIIATTKNIRYHKKNWQETSSAPERDASNYSNTKEITVTQKK